MAEPGAVDPAGVPARAATDAWHHLQCPGLPASGQQGVWGLAQLRQETARVDPQLHA